MKEAYLGTVQLLGQTGRAGGGGGGEAENKEKQKGRLAFKA